MEALVALLVLAGLFLLVAPIAAIVMATGHGSRLTQLATENQALRLRLDALERRLVGAQVDAAPAAAPTAPIDEKPAAKPADTASDETLDDDGWQSFDPPPTAPPSTPSPPKPTRKPFDWERFIGVRLPVWLGALALSLAGFFFVRYSIEVGLVTPAFRVFGALLAALAFLCAAEVVRRRVRADNGPAIAAALAAAGIATFYATAYLASVVYDLIPATAGFIAMIAVTVAAIGIAFVFGQAVAIVGLLGGYITPAIVPSDEPSSAILFLYLSAIYAGMFAIIRLKDWWNISLVALLGPLLWIMLWSKVPGFATDHVWGSAFLLAVSAIAVIAAYPHWSRAERPIALSGKTGGVAAPERVALWALAVSALGFAVFLGQSLYQMPFWWALLLFSLAAVGLAVRWPVALAWAPAAPLAAVSVALLGWDGADPASAAWIIVASAVLFGAYALDQFRRLHHPTLASGLVSYVAIFFFVMALARTADWPTITAQPHLWALGALALAGGMLGLLWRFGPQIVDEQTRNRVYAILASAVTAFLALVVVLELDPLYFPVAAALEVLGLAYVYHRTGLPALRTVAIGLTAVYALLLLGAVGEPGSVDFDFDPSYVLAPSMWDAPWILLVIPGIAFLGAGHFFRRDANDRFANVLDVGGLAMAASGVAVWGDLRNADTENAHGAAARIATLELALAAAAIYVGRLWTRAPLYYAGLGLTVIVMLGLVTGLALPLLEFWPYVRLNGPPIFNIALLSLGLPALLLLGIGWFVRQDLADNIRRVGIVTSVVAVFLLFALMLLDIRHAWHPADLQGATSSAESYIYSIAMLAFGAALLVVGVAIRNLGARILSFVFVLAATIKVFMFDAAGLEGLWRVMSFFGMGLSFLAISWLYARFVFGIRPRNPEQTSPAS